MNLPLEDDDATQRHARRAAHAGSGPLCATSADAFRAGFAVHGGAPRARASIRGSSRRSRTWSARSARSPRRRHGGARRRAAALTSAKVSPTGGWPSCSVSTRTSELREHRVTTGHPPGLQASGHVRRRVRDVDCLPLLDLRGRVRGAPDRQAQDRDPGRRSEPHRPGHPSSTTAACTRRFALREDGFETIMVNCNPETVSTDYDTSGSPVLRAAHLRGRAWRSSTREKPSGVIVQYGGQTPLKLRARSASRRACRSSAPRPIRSTSPRTASASSSWSTG